jgi:hypothetical protein
LERVVKRFEERKIQSQGKNIVVPNDGSVFYFFAVIAYLYDRLGHEYFIDVEVVHRCGGV